MRFQVLTAASMKMTAFWDIENVAVEVDNISEVHTASIIALMTEPVHTSEIFISGSHSRESEDDSLQGYSAV
jgi:hypothetical protein